NNRTALAIHPISGDVYTAGFTDSPDFPGTAGGAQATYGGGFADAFVARFNGTLTSLLQATYLGGGARDEAQDLAIAATGDIYVTGITSGSFPGTFSGAQSAYGGGFNDAFVARLNSTLTGLIQATYLGGSGDEGLLRMAFSPTGDDLYVAGNTSSSNFPAT